uniref:Uncharacterized protein n=1 Tax=Clytia hemisphaerica TaxID=252671 RepID=A0A7M5WYQ8_9CNID
MIKASGNFGLWRSCDSTSFGVRKCTENPVKQVNPKFQLTRGCNVMATIASIVAVIMAFINITQNGNSIKNGGIGMACASGLGIVAGVIFTIFLEHIKDELNMLRGSFQNGSFYEFQYGWAYFLNWAGAGVALFLALISLYDSRTKKTGPPGALRMPEVTPENEKAHNGCYWVYQ